MISLLKHRALARKSYEDCLVENERSRFRDPERVLNEEALDRNVPSFYIAEDDLDRLEKLFKLRKRKGRAKVVLDFRHFRTHPSRCLIKDDADFHIFCVLNYQDLLRWQLLLPRKDEKIFLCFMRVNLDRNLYLVNLPFFRRSDIIFFTFDLGDCILTSDYKMILSGVTIPSPYEYVGEKRTVQPNNRYLLSFKGNCDQSGWFGCCYVRKQLKILATSESQRTFGYLYVDTCDPGVERSKEEYMSILRESTFALAPHGDGRWTHRLVEAIGAGALPVIIADALTLPYEQLIDYSHFCVWIKEEQVERAKSMEEILALLPTDPQQIVRMMEKVALVHDTCFRSPTVRIDMLLLSALHHRLVNRLGT